jgi:hypothetical protein
MKFDECPAALDFKHGTFLDGIINRAARLIN